MAGYVIDMVNVGQGDAFVIATETPKGVVNCLIDAGRKGEGQTVVAHLSRHYKKQLTYAVLTHVDDDHIGGFRAVLDAGIRPKAVYVNDPRAGLAAFVKTATAEMLNEDDVRQITASVATSNTLIDEIRRLQVPIRHAFRNQVIRLSDHLKIGILSPTRDEFPNLVSRFNKRNRDKLAEGRENRRACGPENEASVICAAVYNDGERRDQALFTSDACLRTLQAVASFPFDYVKAPHHGSWHCCDANLVAKWASKADDFRAAFSFGEGNSYGHPDDLVLQWFRDVGAIVLCTHCHGTVQTKRAGAASIGNWGRGLDDCTCG